MGTRGGEAGCYYLHPDRTRVYTMYYNNHNIWSQLVEVKLVYSAIKKA